jgi:acyl-CoA synthetase (AMP-forming)/AMP-acid ligase II
MNPWADAYVADMLDRVAHRRPEQTAIVDGDTRLTYAELVRRRDALAGALGEAGVRPGDNVALLMGEHWQTATTVFALLYLGARVVPFNLTWEAPEIRYALAQADADVLIAASRYRDRDLAPRLAELGLDQPGPVELPDFPRLRLRIGWDRSATGPGGDDLGALLTRDGAPPPRGTLQAGYLLFTSGSTGSAKGAVLRQDATLGTSFYFGERLGLTGDDRFLNTLPFYHGGGLLTHLLGVLQRGATLYLFEGYDHDAMLETLDREACTAMGGFDLVNMRLVRAQLDAGRKLPLERMQVTTEGAYQELTALGVRCSTLYALTESSNFVSMTEASCEVPERQGNGMPFPGVEIRICDYETGEPVGPDVPGEICFRGWNPMVGYYRMAERTRSVFDADGFLHTGDYGWLDAQGQVFYRGRYAMMIKTGGENVSEVEVERYLTANLPGVVNAGVVGVPDDKWGEIVVAFVETSGTFDTDALRAGCRGHLAPYKIPKHFFPVEPGQWPMTPTGKLVKNTLRSRAADLVSHLRSQE